MANAVNEALIRDVIQDVLGRLGGEASAAPAAGEDKGSCGCSGKSGGKACLRVKGGGKTFFVLKRAELNDPNTPRRCRLAPRVVPNDTNE